MNEFFATFSQFHFLRPEFFLVLIPLALFWWLKVTVDNNTQWHQVIPAHLAKVLLTNDQQKTKRNSWLIPLLWLIATAALAGPTWQKIEKPVFQVKRASVIVMDMSMSMRSTDVKPNRLAKAKYKAIDLANAIEDGEIALVAYAGDAFTISPLTPDSKNIINLIPSLSPEIMPEAGSYPLQGLTKASELLEQAGFVKGDIYWFTDGVEHEDIADLNRYIADSRYTFHVMAFGTSEGAPIQMVDKSLLKDQFGSIVIPKLNASQLAQLATVGNGVFVKSTASDLDVRTLLNAHSFQQAEANTEQEADDKLLTGDDWQEAGPYLIFLLLPFVLYAFRRGVTLSLCFCLLLLNTPDATAEETTSTPQVKATSWTDFVFDTKDQVATRDYQQGNYAQAQSTFENAQWKGSAAYKAGDYEAALNYFEQDTSATGQYNKGNALAQLNKLDEAIAAYDEALKQNPEYPEAKANKSLLEQLKQQQEQQQNSDQQQQQNQDQSQQEDQQGGQQQDKEQSEQQQSDDQQQGQESESQQDSQQQSQQQSNSKPEPTAQEQGEQQEQQQQSGEQEGESEETGEPEQQEAQAKESAEKTDQQGEQQAAQLTPEQLAEQEAQQKLEQLLRKVSDDPSVLLRNKMILESRKRQQFGTPPKGAVKSW